MVFNPDPTKQAQEGIFSKKSHSPKHPDLYFINLVVEKGEYSLSSRHSLYDLIEITAKNMNFCNKIESLQYNATLAITGAIRGSSIRRN